VVTAPDGATVGDPPVREAIDTLVAGLRGMPGITAVVAPEAGGSVSADRRVAVVPVAVEASSVAETRSAVHARTEPAGARGPTVHLGGVLATPANGLGPAVVAAVLTGVLLAAGLARWVLGSLRDALAVTGAALVGAGTGTAAAVLVGRPLGLTGSSAVLAFLMGVAVAGSGGTVAVLARTRPAAPVIGGGLVVVVAAGGLAVTGIAQLRVVGIATAVAVAVSVLAVLTLLPARSHPDDPPRSGAPGRWVRLVIGHPVAAIGAATAALALVAVPALIVGGDRADAATGRADELLAAAFGPGAAGPLLLTVEVERADALGSGLPAIAAEAQTLDGVSLAAPGRVAADGTLGVVTVLPTTGPGHPATRELVHRLRDHPWVVTGAVVEVTGATAVAVDVAGQLTDAIPRYLLVVGVLELAVLLVLIRPWTVGLAAAIGSALSIAVTLLVTRALAGWGWAPGVEAMTPIVATAAVVGLVLDQAVRSDRAAPRTVGGCAALVAALFLPATLTWSVPIAGAAVAVAIGVSLDALAVRLVLHPALVTLLTPSVQHGRDSRRVIEQAPAALEPRRGGRHRGD
jgi:RND superfamily putative drug exporter